MDKEQFVSKLASRVDVDQAGVERIVDATLAELVSPALFGTERLKGNLLGDNNCNNNCKPEQALKSPVLSTRG